jgi:hypothetical protein
MDELNLSDAQLKRLSTKDLQNLAVGKIEGISTEGLRVLAEEPIAVDPRTGSPMPPDAMIRTPQAPEQKSLGDVAIGAGEAALSTLSSIPASILGIGGLAVPLPKGYEEQWKKLNPNEKFSGAEQRILRGQEALTYSPRTQTGQEYAAGLGDIIQQSGVQGLIGMPAMQGARIPKVKAEKPGVTSSVLGLTTGTGSEAISQAFKAGKAGGEKGRVFVENLRQEVPVDLVLQDAKAALSEMKANKSADYVASKQGWAADTTRLDFAPIEQSFKSLEDSLKQGKKWKIGAPEQAKVKEVQTVINQWKRTPSLHTTVGLDALKQRIDAIYPDSPKQSQAQRVITGASKAVKDTIVKQAPDYATAMKDYETMSSTIRDIESALSLGNKASKDTALRKLQSLTRNNVQTNYGGRLDMARQLEQVGGENIMPAVSGQALSSITPRGLTGQSGASLAALGAYFNPSTLFALPITSPRLVGEGAFKAGQASRYLPTAPRIPFRQPAAAGLLGYPLNEEQ